MHDDVFARDVPSEVNEHLKKYWSLCVRFFEESEYGLAVFFSITLIEEVGKLAIFKKEDIKRGWEKAFRNHHEKYAYAVAYTMFINSRLSRVYGEEERRFSKWYKNKELLKLRNMGLYLELVDSEIQTPNQLISRDDAFLLVCIAGEVLAEIQGFLTGTGPEEWKRLLEEVDRFRESHLPDDWSP